MLESLVKKARRGNWQAFLELALVKKDMLYHKALVLMQNEHDAADAVEDTILKAYSSLGDLRNPQFFHSWLTRILINTCLEMQRKAKKTLYLEPRSLELAAHSPQEPLADKLDLEEQLAKLDEEHRNILVLRYYADYKISEIAALTGLPVGTVKSRLYYGLRKIRKRMKGAAINEL